MKNLKTIKRMKRMIPAAIAIIFALINTPESAIGYIVLFCVAITLFWLFDTDTPETTETTEKKSDRIDRKAINIDIPIESGTTGINLKK